jgi:glycosyltransferase involved in cell wall biosynthesis
VKKIVHIIKSLNPGGVEKWLKDFSDVNDNGEFEQHIILQSEAEGIFEEHIKNNGVYINKISLDKGKINYSLSLFFALKRIRPDVIHTHVNLSSGWINFIARVAGVKKRIAHCHNDKRLHYSRASLVKRMYYSVMKWFVYLFSTDFVAVSDSAAPSMFFSFSKVRIIPCGLSFENTSTLRTQGSLGIKDGDRVIVQVGRFVDQKNHDFTCNILKDLSSNNWKMLFIGDGELMPKIKERVSELGLSDNVTFLGNINDVYGVLKHYSDILILPSKFEGLGLVAIEAQYFGLKTIVSDMVPKEVEISDNISFLSLDSTSDWIIAIDSFEKLPSKGGVNLGPFSIESNKEKLYRVYNDEW